MPDFLTAQQFSDWEFCPRLVQLGRTIEPPAFPVRHALRRYLLDGIRLLARRRPIADVVFEIPQLFMEEAADRGFEHTIPLAAHERNAYLLIRDYACWLEGVLHLIDELVPDLTVVAAIRVGEYPVATDCWQERADSSSGHTFRITDRASEFSPRWPELLSSLDPSLSTITIHSFILPAPVKDRLASPLVLAYSHPINGHMRLATLDREHTQFTKSWKRTARWEMEGQPEAIEWLEWREGIERDRCLDRCYREDSLELVADQEIKRDAYAIAQAIESGEGIRKREICRRCMYAGYCHGDQASRESYRVISPDLSVPSRHPVSTGLTSPAAARR